MQQVNNNFEYRKLEFKEPHFKRQKKFREEALLLSDFPREIMDIILQMGDLVYKNNCARVCREWYGLIRQRQTFVIKGKVALPLAAVSPLTHVNRLCLSSENFSQVAPLYRSISVRSLSLDLSPSLSSPSEVTRLAQRVILQLSHYLKDWGKSLIAVTMRTGNVVFNLKVFSLCPQLRYLNLQSAQLDLSPQLTTSFFKEKPLSLELPHLEELVLDSASSPSALGSLVEQLPHLERLYFRNLSDVVRFFKNETKPSENQLKHIANMTVFGPTAPFEVAFLEAVLEDDYEIAEALFPHCRIKHTIDMSGVWRYLCQHFNHLQEKGLKALRYFSLKGVPFRLNLADAMHRKGFMLPIADFILARTQTAIFETESLLCNQVTLLNPVIQALAWIDQHNIPLKVTPNTHFGDFLLLASNKRGKTNLALMRAKIGFILAQKIPYSEHALEAFFTRWAHHLDASLLLYLYQQGVIRQGQRFPSGKSFIDILAAKGCIDQWEFLKELGFTEPTPFQVYTLSP